MTRDMVSFAGLEQMLKAYSSNNSFSDADSQKITAALMDEVNICQVQLLPLNDELFIECWFSGPFDDLCLPFLPHDIEQF